MKSAVAMVVFLSMLTAACSASEPAEELPAEELPAESGCADVTAVEVHAEGDGTHRFAVTVLSPDTGWDKYADAWHVSDTGGTVLGERILAHPHVDEQPFTRSLSGVVVPDGVTDVVVTARDSVVGSCGASLTVAIP